MIGLSRRVRVFAYTRAVDMRKQYDDLYALVVAELNAAPLSGDLFLFTNRRRSRAKVLVWDGTGLCVYRTGCVSQDSGGGTPGWSPPYRPAEALEQRQA